MDTATPLSVDGASASTPRVLVVDDQSVFREAARLLLARRGHNVVAVAGCAATALDAGTRFARGHLYKFVVPAVSGPARLVPLPALATEQLSANALRVAAIRGRLKAAKAADGTWRSSKAWVDEYRATRYKRS
jgi:hypothetical protein